MCLVICYRFCGGSVSWNMWMLIECGWLILGFVL